MWLLLTLLRYWHVFPLTLFYFYQMRQTSGARFMAWPLQASSLQYLFRYDYYGNKYVILRDHDIVSTEIDWVNQYWKWFCSQWYRRVNTPTMLELITAAIAYKVKPVLITQFTTFNRNDVMYPVRRTKSTNLFTRLQATCVCFLGRGKVVYLSLRWVKLQWLLM